MITIPMHLGYLYPPDLFFIDLIEPNGRIDCCPNLAPSFINLIRIHSDKDSNHSKSTPTYHFQILTLSSLTLDTLNTDSFLTFVRWNSSSRTVLHLGGFAVTKTHLLRTTTAMNYFFSANKGMNVLFSFLYSWK